MDDENNQNGFTIVELLIVIVVIGILAAITIVAFNGIQNRAHDTAIQSDLKNISSKIQEFRILNDRAPRGSTDISPMNLKISTSAYGNHMPSGGEFYNLVYCWPNAAAPDVFSIVASSKSGNVFESRNGMVRQASYTFTGGSYSICASSGVVIDAGFHRDWFYAVSEWQPYAL